jgi:hypothetical protein
MENPGVVVQSSNGFGIAGFVISLVSLVFGFFIPLVFGLSILSLIFSIIQMKKHRTGLAIAGLVLSIIGIILLVMQIAVVFIWSSTMTDIKEELASGTECLDAVSSIGIASACKDGSSLNVKLMVGSRNPSSEVIFILDNGFRLKKLISDGGDERMFVLDANANIGDSLSISPLVESGVCPPSGVKEIVAC